MRALLLKDLNVMAHGLRVYLIVLAIFAVVPSPGFAGFAMVYASMLPYQSFAYDERSKWDTLAAMMPYSQRMIVSAKYALAWCGLGVVTLLAAASRLVQLVAGRAEALDELISLIPLAGMSLLLLAFTVPLVCRFGVEKGRLLFMAVLALSAIGLVSGVSILGAQDGNAPGVIVLLGVVSAAGILAQPISIAIAQKLYRHRFYEGAGE